MNGIQGSQRSESVQDVSLLGGIKPKVYKKENEKRRFRYQNDPEYREKLRNQREAWKAKNRDKYLASKKRHSIKYKEYYKKYFSEYDIKNRKKRNELSNKWRKNNPEKRKEICNNYLEKHKIERKLTLLLSAAKQRCGNPKFKGYKYYGGRGVKCFLTMDDIKYLWDRDNGFLMKKASLDRVNPDAHYILGNCRIIELSENSKMNRSWQFVKFGMPILSE